MVGLEVVDSKRIVAKADLLHWQLRLVVGQEGADLPPVPRAHQPAVLVVVGDRGTPVRVHGLLGLAGRVIEEAVALAVGQLLLDQPTGLVVEGFHGALLSSAVLAGSFWQGPSWPHRHSLHR